MGFQWIRAIGLLVVSAGALAVSCSEDTPPARASAVEGREQRAPEGRPDGGDVPAIERDHGAELPLGSCKGPGKTLRTLIVGNSQIFYWDLPQLLTDVSRSGPPACSRIDAEGFTRGGQNLRGLWLDGDSLGRKLEPTLQQGKYDVVVVSESIDLVALPPPREQYVTFATTIIDAARASGAVPVLYASPYVDEDAHWGFLEMAAPQLELGKALSVTVAAGGLAWLRVWNEMPDLDLHHPDHAHPGYKGSYISAMVLYAAITRATPIGLTTALTFDCNGQPCPPITPAEGELFQRAAWDEARATSLE
jgi:hypothetical protein